MLDLIAHLDGSSGAALAAAGGVPKLLKLMEDNIDNPEVVTAVLRALNKMCADKAVVSKLVEADAAAAIARAMRQHPGEETVQQESIRLLAKMAATKGVGKIGMDAETMRLINRVVNDFAGNRAIQVRAHSQTIANAGRCLLSVLPICRWQARVLLFDCASFAWRAPREEQLENIRTIKSYAHRPKQQPNLKPNST